MGLLAVATWPLLAFIAGAGLVALISAVLTGHVPARLVKENVVGRPVGAVLGYALWVGVAGGALLAASRLDPPAEEVAVAVSLATAGVTAALVVAGAIDDLFTGGPRGLTGHLGSLVRGRPTTGILKLLVGLGAALVLALHLADDPIRIVGIVALVALCTNLWNALDVVPGRALKWATVALVPLVAAAWTRPSGGVVAATLGAVLVLLPFDLRERGMLGDAGSNPLGFLVGLGLAVVLPTPGLIAAATVALLLQVAAETVTISRLIDAVPPLRWLDRLGRRPEPVS
jgi:Glycosyl transferase family 4